MTSPSNDGPDSNQIYSDVARIRLSGGPVTGKGAFGSGRLIAPGLVLTARHLLETEKGIPLSDEGWEIRLLRDRTASGKWREDEKPLEARVIWRGRDVDLALLELLTDSRQPLIGVKFGYLKPLESLDVWVIGFPMASWTDHANAKEHAFPASLSIGGLDEPYRIAVPTGHGVAAPELWKGLSGGAVIAWIDGAAWLVGVVQRVPANFDPKQSLDAARVERACREKEFVDQLTSRLSTTISLAAVSTSRKLFSQSDVAQWDILRIMHLINRKDQAKSLESRFRKVLNEGPITSPLVVFASGSPRASFRALVSRFSWYIVPIAKNNLRLRDFASATDIPILQPCGIPLDVDQPLSAALDDVNEQILYELSPPASRDREKAGHDFVTRLRNGINTAPPIIVFFSLHNVRRTSANLNAITNWLDFWRSVRGPGLAQPIVLFFCATFSFTPLPFPLSCISPAARYSDWLRRSLEGRSTGNIEVLVLDELPAIRFKDMRAWAENLLPELAPTLTAKIPSVISALRRHFYLRLKQWHLEDVFETLGPLIREKLTL
jgi:hypothetical protein